MTRELRHLLNKVNAVTAPHRHGNPVSKRKLDDLANAQVEYEQAVPAMDRCPKCQIAGHNPDCPSCLRRQITELRQALWDVYAELGFDTDGDPTPAAVVNLIPMVVSAAKEHRTESDQASREKVCVWDGTHPGCQSSKVNHIYSRLPTFCEYCGGRVKKAK